jgi:hypothetical protein
MCAEAARSENVPCGMVPVLVGGRKCHRGRADGPEHLEPVSGPGSLPDGDRPWSRCS